MADKTTEKTAFDASGESDAERTASVVSAYVSNNPVPVSELPNLIASVHGALKKFSGGESVKEADKPVPAVNPKKSVHPDYIVCLEDGQKFKSLKRHLNTHHGMTPEEYREKWNLPADYPMVAPDYAKQRSDLAKSMGLGRKPGQKRGRKK